MYSRFLWDSRDLNPHLGNIHPVWGWAASSPGLSGRPWKRAAWSCVSNLKGAQNVDTTLMRQRQSDQELQRISSYWPLLFISPFSYILRILSKQPFWDLKLDRRSLASSRAADFKQILVSSNVNDEEAKATSRRYVSHLRKPHVAEKYTFKTGSMWRNVNSSLKLFKKLLPQ